MRRFELAPLPGESDNRNRTVDADPQRVLENLNPAQQEAARQTEGPVMIIAGAGSGKTRTLTHRIAYLLATGTTDASRILALTFTNKAASEMKERVFELVGKEGARGLWMGTFHSIFARLLRREAEAIGYTADFSIYDTDDSRRIIKNLMERYGFDTSRFKPRSLHSMISNAKNHLVSPAEYQESAYGPYEERVAQLFGPYQETLKQSNAMDFDDLLLKPIELFEHEPDVLARYQNRWQYIHIDEYQDTNRAQYRLAQLLADSHKNLCVVGDDAQSIYKFRGADIRNILDFRNDFPGAEVVRLEQNYRSTKHILQLADSVIEHNDEQIEKTLWTDNEEGEPVQLFRAMSEKDEARKIAQSIKNLRMREGYSWDDFAILYRTNAQSRSLEERLRQQDIPYQVVGGLSFYERKEIKDVLAYLQLVVNPHDVASLRRVINYPRRGIGQRTQEKIEKLARQRDIPVWEALHHVEELGLRTRQENSVREFRELIEKYASLLDEEPADEVGRALIEETGILEDLRNEDTAESLSRWENVQELLNAITEFVEEADEDDQGLNRFLQEVSLMTDVDGMEDEGAQVTLLTLHASKGLEFPVVFVTGLEEGLFPLSRATEVKEELEEERRLFYVGVTRAEERLFLTYAITRYQYGQHKDTTKSRFLDEIDTSVVRDESGSRPNQTKGRFSGGSRSSGRASGTDDQRRTVRTSSGSSSNSGRRVVYDEGEAGPIVPGVRVEHDKFGEGKVLSVEGEGPKAKATVFFNDVGQKKLMLQYAGLRIVE